jgi:hypothetical protein
MKHSGRRVVTSAALVGCSGFLLYNFIIIWRYGWIGWCEPNRTILGAEIVLFGLLVLLGILGVIKETKEE